MQTVHDLILSDRQIVVKHIRTYLKHQRFQYIIHFNLDKKTTCGAKRFSKYLIFFAPDVDFLNPVVTIYKT